MVYQRDQSSALWNIGYNKVLEAAVPLESRSSITPIIAVGRKWVRTLRIIETAVAAIITKIRGLGLEIAAQKTETLWFHGLPRTQSPPQSRLSVQGDRMLVKEYMRYLDIILDGRLNFNVHFSRLSPRIEGVATLLGRLLPTRVFAGCIWGLLN